MQVDASVLHVVNPADGEPSTTLPAAAPATGAPEGSAVTTQELFGPVVAFQTFGTASEAIALANATEYGLAASVGPRSGHRVPSGTRRPGGVVSVNAYSEGDITTPFGGWKQSGFGGAEKSTTAFDQWTREKPSGSALAGVCRTETEE